MKVFQDPRTQDALGLRLAPAKSSNGVDPTAKPSQHSQQPFQQPYYSIPELAERWRCSRGTVYNRLRFASARVLDFASAGKKGKKLVPGPTVFQIEARHTKRLE
jgi:hypothetical protein